MLPPRNFSFLSLGGPGPFPCTPEAALTNARLGSNPGEPQVENHTPDIEHAADLGGEGGQRPPGGWVPQDQTPTSRSPVMARHQARPDSPSPTRAGWAL